ncbi:MAG: TonB-dependent receptor [Bacteroidetes bacterium]|nr:TonB-dependent receptor [Bacteroidota bacterium]
MRELFILVLLLSATDAFPQSTLTGKVFDAKSGEALTGANVILEGSDRGSVTDLDGEFVFDNLERETYILRVSYIGYAVSTREVDMSSGYLRVEIALVPVSYEFNTIVVTGTRTEKKRTEVPIIVNILKQDVFASTNSRWLLDGLSYQTGVRMEVDCQTCNYSQVRLNGLGGAYSQILINSKPVFSALSGLYGLEQIPATMLDRVEVIRGGGSALFGANAVAGTINIITREPVENSYSLSVDNSVIGGSAPDRSLDMTTTFVDPDRQRGITVFGSFRDRAAWDANMDGFSEIPEIRNNSFGLTSYHKTSRYSKISLDLHSIHEERRGGNKLSLPPHQADQAEDRIHNILGGGLTFSRDVPELLSSLSAYVSGQRTDRSHYTGIDGEEAYGTTDNLTMVTGVQFSRSHLEFLGGGENTITVGVEGQYDDVFDEIPLYQHRLEQITRQAGVFLQTDWKATGKFGILLGLRGDVHSRVRGPVINPRINLMYDLTSQLQLRTSFATGFRAPQAFDADLHVAFAGGGVSLIRIDPALEMERSVSYSTSLDFNVPSAHRIWGFTLDGFLTRINNIFILEELGPDPVNASNTILLRSNGPGATVAGASVEVRANFDNMVEFQTGLTMQRSVYDEKVFWSSSIGGTENFTRSPDMYGFYLIDINLLDPFRISLNGVLTGPMDVPHFAGAPGVDADALRRSETFFESNLRLSWRFSTDSMGGDGFELYIGARNMFDSYQKDFDTGPYRDSNYIYGPARPRTLYAGIRIGSL